MALSSINFTCSSSHTASSAWRVSSRCSPATCLVTLSLLSVLPASASRVKQLIVLALALFDAPAKQRQNQQRCAGLLWRHLPAGY